MTIVPSGFLLWIIIKWWHQSTYYQFYSWDIIIKIFLRDLVKVASSVLPSVTKFGSLISRPYYASLCSIASPSCGGRYAPSDVHTLVVAGKLHVLPLERHPIWKMTSCVFYMVVIYYNASWRAVTGLYLTRGRTITKFLKLYLDGAVCFFIRCTIF